MNNSLASSSNAKSLETEPIRAKIPGLPEKERIKALNKSKKKKGKSETNSSSNLTCDYFKKVNSNIFNTNLEDRLDEYEFSDYDNDQFEDSKEVLSDSDSDSSSIPVILKRPRDSPEATILKKKTRTASQQQ